MSVLLAAATPSAFWYLTRGTGVVALLLADGGRSCSACSPPSAGAATAWPRFVVAGLHRNLTLLAVAFLAVHVVTTDRRRLRADPPDRRRRPVHLRRTGRSGSASARSRSTSCSPSSSRACCARGSAFARGAPCTGSPTRPGRSRSCTALGTGSDSRLGWLAILTLGCAAAVAAAVARSSPPAQARPRLRVAAGVATRSRSPLSCSAGTDPARLSRAGRRGPARRRRSCADTRRRRRRARSRRRRPSPPRSTARLTGRLTRGPGRERPRRDRDRRNRPHGGRRRRCSGSRSRACRVGDGGVSMTDSGVTFAAASARRTPAASSGSTAISSRRDVSNRRATRSTLMLVLQTRLRERLGHRGAARAATA